jgi:aminopeptidase 2
MLMDHVGEPTFVRGVAIYLKKHLYGNTVSQDLWDGISEAVGHDVGAMMRSWVGEAGFPVLVVTETAGGIRVRQDRFFDTGKAKPDVNKTIWCVPALQKPWFFAYRMQDGPPQPSDSRCGWQTKQR